MPSSSSRLAYWITSLPLPRMPCWMRTAAPSRSESSSCNRRMSGSSQAGEGTRMAHFQLATADRTPHFRVQVQQAQQVGDAGPGTADGIGGLLMGEAEFIGQSLERARLFQRIQVLALDVLDQGDRNGS